MKKKKVLLFGGSFNPPTLAHEAIIGACLDLTRFKEVWVMPSGDRSDKRMGASDQQRLKMLELIRRERFASNPRLKIVDFELNLARPTATYKTVEVLARDYPDHEFWFVFGADSYASMDSWPHGEELREQLRRLVLFARGADDHIMGNDIINLTIPRALNTVSSTYVREALLEGRSTAQDISEPVLRYIRRHKLYRGSGEEDALRQPDVV